MKYRAPFTLIKRGRYWYYRVYVGDCRKTLSTGQTAKSRAMEHVLAKLSHQQLEIRLVEKTITFKEFAKDFWEPGRSPFLRYKEKLGKRYSPRYIENCRRMSANHLVPAFGKMKLGDIRNTNVQEWLFMLSDNGMSPKTANNLLSVLSLMLEEAVRLEVISDNPCKRVDRLSGKSRERGRLSVHEARMLFSDISYWGGNTMKYTANLLAAVTGMRSREVAALRGQNIRDGYLVVEHSFDERYGLKCTKTGDRRELPVPPFVLELLNDLKRGDDDWLFSLDGAKPVNERYFLDGLRTAMERIGISREEQEGRNISFHSWRHFLNSLLLANGTDRIMTQRITGHTTDAMTEHYAHFNAEDYRSVLDVTSKVLPVS